MVAAHSWQGAHQPDNAAVYGTFARRLVMAPGQTAVPVFFAVSAYLLFLPFARRDFGSAGPVSYRVYYANRAVRALPLYWISMTFLLLTIATPALREQWWKYILMVQGFDTEATLGVNPATWSVVTDMQFYVLLPVFAYLLARVTQRQRGAAILVLLGTAILSMLVFESTRGQANSILWLHSLFVAASSLAAGMILAILRLDAARVAARLRGPLRHTDIWVLAGIGCAMVAAYDYRWQPMTSVAAFLVLGAIILPLKQGVLLRVLDIRVLAKLGIATYSVYLWQGPILRQLVGHGLGDSPFLLLLAVGMPLAITAGLLSYHLIEAPFLRLRRSWSTASAAVEPDARSGKPPERRAEPPNRPAGPPAERELAGP